ncbi:MAG: TerC family protein [Verrucomicrobiota bacterium]|nr:TerC family protein [Chthoniobacterales bacterium]MBA3763075.1 TerC family protein [Chthoniobacterales bacterium]MDQ3315207.1 TerC family protein [Verrucomicrobiota bacterium]
MPVSFWIAFHIGVFVVLAIDLVGFNRKAHAVTIKEASIWSIVWVLLSLSFNVLVWHLKGDAAALDFFTGYVIEYSLSVDNIFVFVLIFTYFQVRRKYQHRVLVWGILGALVMRGTMIALGVSLVQRFHWILYIFGAFLLITGVRMLVSHGEEIDLESNFVLRFCRRWMPVTPEYHGEKFIVKERGKWMLTPLALVLIVIDIMDLVFAVDSIPAVFAITQDEFIIYTSNICAILGLRSLYFVLAHVIDRFIYLKTGLAFVLGFVGLKMILANFIHIPNWVSLLIIVTTLTITIVLSMRATRGRGAAKEVLPPVSKVS